MLKWYTYTQKEALQEEIKRLNITKDADSNFKVRINGIWQWMKPYFEKSEKELLKEGFKTITCKSCGKEATRVLKTDFSFCDEYDCNMTLCEVCVKELIVEAQKMLDTK